MMKCQVCQVSMNSSGQYQQHLAGKLHAKKLKQMISIGQREPNQKGQTSGLGKKGQGHGETIHLVSPGYRQPGSQYGLEAQPNPAAAQTSNPGTQTNEAEQDTQKLSGNEQPLVFGDHNGIVSVSRDNNYLYCQICFLKLNSPEQAEFHYRGARHLKKAKIARMYEIGAIDESAEKTDQGYFCGFCNVTVNSSQQLLFHREGVKHKKMVELRKRHMTDSTESEPRAKKPSSDDTGEIPSVDPSHTLPPNQVSPAPTAASS